MTKILSTAGAVLLGIALMVVPATSAGRGNAGERYCPPVGLSDPPSVVYAKRQACGRIP